MGGEKELESKASNETIKMQTRGIKKQEELIEEQLAKGEECKKKKKEEKWGPPVVPGLICCSTEKGSESRWGDQYCSTLNGLVHTFIKVGESGQQAGKKGKQKGDSEDAGQKMKKVKELTEEIKKEADCFARQRRCFGH